MVFPARILGVTINPTIGWPINDIHYAAWMHEDAKLAAVTKNDIQRQSTAARNGETGPPKGV